MTTSQLSDEMTPEAAADSRAMFGFWVYLMSDLLMFAVLFAVYAVLRGNTVGGPTGRDLFSPSAALTGTIILLTSSLTCGIGMVAARGRQKSQAFLWFSITFALGLIFLILELHEFAGLISDGQTLRTNAFLSAFFVLVGTHGLHIISGLIWMAVMLPYIMKRGLNNNNLRKLSMFSLFWHFLDIVWIFIFSVVYLMAFT